jgi:hypothetical protein
MDREKRYKIRKSHLSTCRKTSPPIPAPSGEKGIQITSNKGVVHLKVDLALRRRVIWILLFLSGLTLLLLMSSLDDKVRSTTVDILLRMLQVLIFNECLPRK